MKKIIAAYTGTFDPITFGHIEVIRRAADCFEKLIIMVSASTPKNPIFNLEERIEFIQNTFAKYPNVSVLGFEGLLVHCAQTHHVNLLVRGIRNGTDFDYERQMAAMNRYLAPEIDTVMFDSAPQYAHISSTLVREIAKLQGNIEGLVPPMVAQALKDKFS